MSEEKQYTTVLTKQGLAYETECLTSSSEFHITHIAIGDGNGLETTPNENQTSLINEVKRYAITGEEVNLEKGLYYAITKVPEIDGGFTIRELGGYNAAGKLVMVSNFPPTVKHVQELDDLHKVYIRMDLCKVNSKTFPSVVDPNLSTPSMDYLTEKLANKADINLANLTPQGNAKLHYPVFCFNSGRVNDKGECVLCSLDGDILTQHAPCVCTTSDGQTYIISEDITLDISEFPDGNYNVFYFPETKEMKAYANTIYIQDCQPAWSENDIWVDTSVMPYITKQNILGVAQVVKCIPNTRLVVSQPPKIENKQYNYGIRKGKPPLTYGNVSNNIKSAPQLVKWKLEDGVLTLLVGSIARWAAGKQAPTLSIGDLIHGMPIVDISWDGTNLIYYTQTQQDYSWTFSTYTGYVQMFLQDDNGPSFWGLQTDQIQSGNTPPTTPGNTNYYNTDDNTCVHLRDNIAQSFPLMKCYLNGASGITNVCEVYQTGGCIGSTVWSNKNVSMNLINIIDSKCGLASIEHTTEYDYLITFSNTFTRSNANIFFFYNMITNEKNIYLTTTVLYNKTENYVWNFVDGKNALTSQCNIGTNLTVINGEIKSYNPRMPFRAADAQDIDGHFIVSSRALLNGVNIASQGTTTIDLTSYLPMDGKMYEVILNVSCVTGTTSGNTARIYAGSDIITSGALVLMCAAQTRATANVATGGNGVIPVGNARYIILQNIGSNTATVSVTASGFRQIH